MRDSGLEAERPQPAGRRIALLLEYDGGRFAGSQLQKAERTVQSVLEDAILKTTGEAARASFAGRTDAGVHARGQVASFVTGSRLDLHVMRRALNAWLPEDVAVKDVAEVDPAFDVRRDAVRRHYRYVLHTGPTRPALERARAWHTGSLDAAAMAAAAGRLLGEHDFAAFAGPLERPGASSVRCLYEFELRLSCNRVVCEVTGNAFLPHQVRRMVGSLVEVGRGKMTAQEYGAQLTGPPSSAGPAAPAYALYLMGVDYAPPLFEAGLDSDASVC